MLITLLIILLIIMLIILCLYFRTHKKHASFSKNIIFTELKYNFYENFTMNFIGAYVIIKFVSNKCLFIKQMYFRMYSGHSSESEKHAVAYRFMYILTEIFTKQPTNFIVNEEKSSISLLYNIHDSVGMKFSSFSHK